MKIRENIGYLPILDIVHNSTDFVRKKKAIHYCKISNIHIRQYSQVVA